MKWVVFLASQELIRVWETPIASGIRDVTFLQALKASPFHILFVLQCVSKSACCCSNA